MNIFEKILEDPKRFRTAKIIFYISLAVILLIEIAVVYVLHLGHGHFWFEDLPAFGSIYGFISCVLIIVVSKFIGHHWLMKKEDYYND
ncbi:MAG: hypothetical protein HZA05_00970 [Nitrospirae bacterium]|jgi:membrane protein YdbS with pleckstrin-like domain|nr:hypothetical protein [Nitrospirota bacterium]